MQASPDTAKRNAAYAAAEHVKDGMVVGLRQRNHRRLCHNRLRRTQKTSKTSKFWVYPAATKPSNLQCKNGIPITTLEEHPIIDVNIDGADQIDPQLNLIKGMGAALAREKIVASSSRQNIFIADEKKYVKILGENNHPVPIEVLPFAIPLVQHRIQALVEAPCLEKPKANWAQ